MDKQDFTREQEVWQRVQANRQEGLKNDLRQLRRESAELAEVYRKLSTQLSGKTQELANRLYRGEKANGAALAGIGKLSRTGGESIRLWQPGKEDPQSLLERCYHRTRRCMSEYLARSADGEFGLVFQTLADREKEHCVLIAELLGSLG